MFPFTVSFDDLELDYIPFSTVMKRDNWITISNFQFKGNGFFLILSRTADSLLISNCCFVYFDFSLHSLLESGVDGKMDHRMLPKGMQSLS